MRWLVVCAWVLWPLHAFAHPTIAGGIDGKPCVACHVDVHHGEFAGRDGGACAGCHTTMAWAPSTFDATKHATTGYVLDGKHLATPCSGCHAGGRPRTSFLVASSSCLDCHQNPHGARFAGRKETACGDCHTTAAWRQWKVDHRTWPLVGAHARMACVGCHPDKTIDTPRAAYRGVARTCEGCHADLHATQFATTPVRACADCHGQERWKTLTFDHAKTRYPLEGVHVTLTCDGCHGATTLRNGDMAIRWRLGYAACKDCHANPHPKVTLDCKGCHGATTWKPTGTSGAGFDHDATGFTLRQRHAQVACTACHGGKRPPAPAGGRTNSTCQSCHPDPHMGHMAGQCFECHTAVGWQDVAMFEQHRRTRMPLTGRHAVIACGACHQRQADRGFRDLPTDCFGCHGKVYAATPGHTANPRECQVCHATTAWTPARKLSDLARLADHDRSFVLSSGGHRAVPCEGCHVDLGGPGADRRRPRAVRCDGCHQAASVRKQHRQPVAAVATACLGCHPRGVRR
ncbi:MAG: hypothetical protein NT062_00610 [Proteobacteria bacterium]|nr:hypothetical protein [Pseudomonadota bacterium]